MAFSEFLFGKPGGFEQLQNYNPQQQQAFNSLLPQILMALLGQQGGQGQGGGLFGSQFGAGFEPIAQQARNEFNQSTIPSLAERFTSLGAQGSSAFQQSIGQAGAGLQNNLAAQKAQFGLQSMGPILQLLNTALTPQFQHVYRPQTQGLAQPLLQGFGEGIGSYASGGVAGLANMGAKKIGNAFNGAGGFGGQSFAAGVG